MRVFAGLIVLARVDLCAPALDIMYCVDASKLGYCVMISYCSESEARETFKWRERSRFLEGELDHRDTVKSHLRGERSGRGYALETSLADTRYTRCLFAQAGLPYPGDGVLETSASPQA